MLLENNTKSIIIYSSLCFFISCCIIIYYFTSPKILTKILPNGDVVTVTQNEAEKYQMEYRAKALKQVVSYYLPIIFAILSFLFEPKKKDTVNQEIVSHDANIAKTANRVALFVSFIVLFIPIFFHLAMKIEDANDWVLNCQIPVQAALSPIFSYYFGVGIKGNSSK